MSQHGSEVVYEMMWDCKYCGQKKLLGLTHRYCAGCGAPQDPAARYFPPDSEKVLAKDHPYVGADVACPACRQPMSLAAKCCTSCGSPIDKGVAVQRRADVVVPPGGAPGAPGGFGQGFAPAPGFPPGPGAPFGAAPPKKKSRLGLVIGLVAAGLALLLIAVVLVAALWKRDASLRVAGHTWQRSVEIQRYDLARTTAWCDQRPSGGREISRHQEQRGTKKVKDGETCRTRKKDRGNGTYSEVKECTPKYRDEPVMSDRCEFEVTAWRTERTLTEKGASTSDAPRWPVVPSLRTGTCLGCEREGARTEKYTVRFVDTASNEEATCDVPQARWSALADGSRWKAKVRVMTGGVDCDALVAQ
jgi:hypothetical protein